MAIKFFDSTINKNNSDLEQRFIRESHILADLQHPSIPYILTSGSVPLNNKKIPYIIMEFIAGLTLEDYFKNHSPMSLDDALNISYQVLDALSFVHEKGIVHRDIKPSNIMILSSGHCYIIDFSIGFKIDPQPGMTRVTQTGDHLGTFQYMSPEQKLNMKNVDQRTDVYSYALVLCEMLFGKPEPSSIISSKHKLPSTLINVIKKACSYETNERYNNAGDFLRELKQVSSKSLPFLDTPSKAMCTNTTCENANWSHRGYYLGPYLIEESNAPFCSSCGSKLIYQCSECGSPISNTKFCGGCGTQQFNIPECLQCGSFLTKIDMDKDTKKYGCEKCKAKNINKKPPPISIEDLFDDDIPF